MITLTRPDGSTIHFGQGFVVQPIPRGTQALVVEGSHALVIYGGVQHYVRETPDEAVAAIERGAAGA